MGSVPAATGCSWHSQPQDCPCTSPSQAGPGTTAGEFTAFLEMELTLRNMQGARESGAASTSLGQVPAWLSAVGLAALPLVAWSQYSLFQTGDLLSIGQLPKLMAGQQLTDPWVEHCVLSSPWEMLSLPACLYPGGINKAPQLAEALCEQAVDCHLGRLEAWGQQRVSATCQSSAWPVGGCTPVLLLAGQLQLVRPELPLRKCVPMMFVAGTSRPCCAEQSVSVRSSQCPALQLMLLQPTLLALCGSVPLWRQYGECRLAELGGGSLRQPIGVGPCCARVPGRSHLCAAWPPLSIPA